MARELGRYELLRPLARGGMAEIYLARRRSAGIEKLLVVKRLRAERAGDARFLELFVREARLSMSLAHQNIVPVFDFGRAGDQVFLAMERVEGRDLGSTLARPGVAPLPPVVAAWVAAECCQALDYAHRKRRDDGAALGVVHRDVTPRNVLASWSGEVKLTDFGIAALAGEETSRLIGTPAYMAPEQARGEPIDARADLYATGLVLREVLTGQRARPGADRDALVAAARRGELLPWPAGASGPLVEIVERATAADPADRYPDARAMLAALDAYIVAARAAEPGEAPARRLAVWLAAAWEGERDDGGDAESAERPELLSMLGELADGEPIGTGTERSLAATADDPMSPAPVEAATKEAGAKETGAKETAPEEAAPEEPAPQKPTPQPRRRPRTILAIALVAGFGLIFASALRRELRRTDGPSDAAIAVATPVEPPRDARVPDAETPDAETPDAPAPSPLPSPDAAILVEATPDAAPAVAVAQRPRTRPDAASSLPPPPDAAPAPARVLRKVRINARPWATFTVDGGATSYETISTIELAPGLHTLHFRNPQLGVEREVTIQVPADRDLDHVEDLRR